METNFYKVDSFYISREKKSQTAMPSRHYHDAYEILYLVSGDICYFIGDKAYQVVGGVLLIIGMNEIHKLVNSSGATFERITLQFKREFLDDLSYRQDGEEDLLTIFDGGKHIVRLAGHEQNFIENLFDRMIHEDSKKPQGYQFYSKTLLFELLLFIKRKFDAVPNQDASETNLVHKKIFEIVDFINRNYHQRLTIQQISRDFYISPSYFCKAFRDNTGFTFTEYLNNVRIKEARLLLKDGNSKISDIAEKTGFDSSTHFGRVFKEITRVSPLKYRSAARAENS